MICTPETNFCRIFELPLHYPEKYCFGGGVPVEFRMVDWFNPVSDSMQEKDWETEIAPMLREFVTYKAYIRQNRDYLLITDFGKVIFFSNPRPAKLG